MSDSEAIEEENKEIIQDKTMGFPTLLRKGFIIPPPGSSGKRISEIKNMRGIDYVLQFISDRIPTSIVTKTVKKMAASYGEKVLLLKSKTGSGKSTVLPPALHEAFYHRTQRNIICTQPRVVTAMDIPISIIEYYKDLVMGKNIGYSTEAFKNIPKQRGIIFSTVGILLRELKQSDDLEIIKKFQFIIVDEIHNRDLDIDNTLFLLKKFLQNNYKNPLCPMVIFMSATFDENIFMRYFEIPDSNYIQIEGSTFPIKEHFLDYSISSYVRYSALKAQHLHLNNIQDLVNNDFSRDIIIFVKDSGVGRKVAERLHLFNAAILDNGPKVTSLYKSKLDDKLAEFDKKDVVGGATDTFYILPLILDSQSYSKSGIEYQNLFSDIKLLRVPIWDFFNKNETLYSENASAEELAELDISKMGEIDLKSLPKKYVVPSRRIIIATDVAETGITIDSLKYCIDTGYKINAEFFPEYGCTSLLAKNISLNSAIQRKGRVGRKAVGYWYPFYTKKTFESFTKEHLSSIIINDTTEMLLSVLITEKRAQIIIEYDMEKIKNNKYHEIFQMFKGASNKWFYLKNELNVDILNLDFIELPSIQMLKFSIEKLHILGYIDSNYNITPIGYYADKFRFISLEARKMIMAGFSHGADILSLVTIAAFAHTQKRYIFEKKFHIQNFLTRIYDESEFKYYNKFYIGDDFIDSLCLYNAMVEFIESNITKTEKAISDAKHNESLLASITSMHNDKLKKWCVENMVKYDGIITMLKFRDQILEVMISEGMNVYYNGLDIKPYNLNKIIKNSLSDGLEEIKKIKACIYEGYKLNLLKFNPDEKCYYGLYKNIPIANVSFMTAGINVVDGKQYRPKFVVSDSIAISQKFDKEQYEFIALGFSSNLDGFITPDETIYTN